MTNQPILNRNGLLESQLQQLPVTAMEAFLAYRRTSLSERQRIILNALAIMRSEQDLLARELTEQMGRPIAYTAKEITTAIARAEYLVRISDAALERTPGEPENGFKRYIKKEPLGVVLIIFAWNVGGLRIEL